MTDQETLNDSLRSVQEYLDNVTDEELLKSWESVYTGEGITVDEYLNDSLAIEEYFEGGV